MSSGLGKVFPRLDEHIRWDVIDFRRRRRAVFFPKRERTPVARFMLHQCEATPLGIIGVRGIRILLWVEAGDVDQRIALVGELESMVIARVLLLKALEARIDG